MNIIKNELGFAKEAYLGIILFFALILPHTRMSYQLVVPIMFLSLMLTKRKFVINKYVLGPILAMFFSLILNSGNEISEKSVLTACSILLCLLSFPLTSNAKIKNIYIYLCFSVIFISQISYIFHWESIINIINENYPISWNEKGIENMIRNVNEENYTSFRLGGLYRNPNHCAKYVSFLLVIFFVNNKGSSIIKLFPFMAISFYSILLTGSRTGFFVGSATILFALFQNKQMKNKAKIILIFVFLVFLFNVILSEQDFRGTLLQEGFENSAGSKFRLFKEYFFNENSYAFLLFGHFDMSLFQSVKSYSLDAEYGYIIYCYGLIGFLAFGIALWKIYQKIEKQNKFFFVVLFWMISSSIFMSFRTVFVFMLLLSTIYHSSQKKEVECQRQNFLQ